MCIEKKHFLWGPCYYVQKNCLFCALYRNITVQAQGCVHKGVPGFPCRAIFGVREEILVFRKNIHLWKKVPKA